MKFTWIYLVLAINYFSYGEQIISFPYLTRELSANQDEAESPFEFYNYESPEDKVTAIIWSDDEEKFFNQESIRIPDESLDTHIELPVITEGTDTNVIEEYIKRNEQNNYDITGTFGGGGFVPDQQPTEEHIHDLLNEDIKIDIVSTFGGGGFVPDQQPTEEHIHDLLNEDMKIDIVGTFGGGGGALLFRRVPEDEMNKLLREYRNTQDSLFIYKLPKSRIDKRKEFLKELVGTFGGGGITPSSEYISDQYLDYFSTAFVVVRRQSFQEHLDSFDGDFQNSLAQDHYLVPRDFIESNEVFPAQLNMSGIIFQ